MPHQLDANGDPPLEGMCFGCEKICDPGEFCFGCKEFWCEECDQAIMGLTGRHDPHEHFEDNTPDEEPEN